MTLTLAGKQAVVEEVANVAAKAISAVVADYRGLTVNQMTQLRKAARDADVYLRIVPNNLTRRAFEGTDFACLNDKLIGPSFIALSFNAPSDAARILKDNLKTLEKLKIKALAVNGKTYEADQLELIASLPTKDEAIAKLMSVMKAPVEKFVRTLAAPTTKLVRTFTALRDKKSA